MASIMVNFCPAKAPALFRGAKAYHGNSETPIALRIPRYGLPQDFSKETRVFSDKATQTPTL